MTSCKPPTTCIDASPIPDANDSRMSAIPYEANLTPMGASPLRYSTGDRLPARGRGEAASRGAQGQAGAVRPVAPRGQDPADRAQFGLSLHEGKTRLIEFGRFAAERRAAAGQRRPETFDFLGFTHY